MTIPKEMSWKEMGHNDEQSLAFGPNYTPSEIGGNFDLSLTIFGYEVTEKEVNMLMEQFKTFKHNVATHSIRRKKHGLEQFSQGRIQNGQ